MTWDLIFSYCVVFILGVSAGHCGGQRDMATEICGQNFEIDDNLPICGDDLP